MCRGGGFAPTSRKWKDSRGSSFTAAALEAFLCSTHLWTTNCASHTGTKETKEPRTAHWRGSLSAAVGLNPHSGGPGEAGVGLGTRGRVGLRAFVGAVPQRELSRSARKAACFLFLFRCVWAGGGVTGGDLKPPQSEGTADTTRPAGACGPAGGFLRSSSSRRPSRHVLPLKR